MAMGKRTRQRQRSLLMETGRQGHPFYRRLNQLLGKHGFDEFVEAQCARFYAERLGRLPATYFRLVSRYFEGIGAERGITWRAADSISLGEFLGYTYTLSDETPDHSTISRNRRLIDVETQQEVFSWVLRTLYFGPRLLARFDERDRRLREVRGRGRAMETAASARGRGKPTKSAAGVRPVAPPFPTNVTGRSRPSAPQTARRHPIDEPRDSAGALLSKA